MSTPNQMPQIPQLPQLPQQGAQQRPQFYAPNGPPRQFSPPFPNPSPGIPPSSPALGYNQPPAAKRPKLSPNPQSPYGSPMLSTIQPSGAASPPNGQVNGGPFSPPAHTGGMQPPPRPVEKEKATDIRTIEDSLAGTGVNIDDEERALTSFGPSIASQSFVSQPSFGANGGSFDRTGSQAHDGVIPEGRPALNGAIPGQDGRSREEAAKLEIEKANYLAGGRRQYELTDPFLHGDALEKKLNLRAYENGIKSPKEGLYHARKDPNRPPQKMQVASPDGSVRVIDKGQTILNSDAGSTLVALMDLISLACKSRMHGILDLAGRLGKERRDLANGRIPDDWKDIAQSHERAASPAAAQSLKRSHSQANGEVEDSKSTTVSPVVHIFRQIAEVDRSKEEARLNKRLKRTSKANGLDTTEAPSTPATPGTPTTPLDTGKKVTKKDQKVAEAKFTEAQQHKHANETARMATSNLLGGSNIFGNKKKTYAWMTGGGGGAKAAPAPMATTAAKLNTALSDNAPAVVNGTKPTVTVPKTKQFGLWDDGSEKPTAIPVRDILAILESDERALKTLQQGYNKPEGRG